MKFSEEKPENFVYIQRNTWYEEYKKLLDTAISSWSGFVYQGKVAIYHVLKNIHYNTYSLQLDSIDDFSILNNQQIISLHQVKAKKSTTFGTYEEAFGKLKHAGIVLSCNNLFFHLAREITNIQIDAIETTFNPIQVYKYDCIPYCSVNQIDTKIEELIIPLLPHGQQSSEYASKARKYMDNIITAKLFEIHKIVHLNLLTDEDAAYTQQIPFQSFIDILNIDLNQEDLGDNYYLYQIKNDICRYYQEYCIDNELENTKLRCMNSFISFFNTLQEKDLIKFIKNIIPHRTFKFESLRDYKHNSPQETEIKNIFIYMLHQIDKEPQYIQNSLLKWNKNLVSYSPTCIYDNYSGVDNICMNIINNALSTDLDILFESQTLLTRGIEVDSITSSHIVRNSFKANNIMQWESVSLKDIDLTKGDINA